MREKGYYSVRTGKNAAGVRLDLAALKKLFLSFHHQFGARDYFQEAFGYNCVDQGDVTGSLGEDIDGIILLALRKDNLLLLTKIDGYSEDDLFDMIEFFYDQVSKPLEGHYHSYSGCGMHYSTFDRDAGRAEYRAKLNPLLVSYADGYQLSDVGEIMALPDSRHG